MKMLVSDATPRNINAAAEANEKGHLIASTPIETTTANGVFSVAHDLGVRPDDFRCIPYGSVIVYATRANQLEWSDTLLWLTGTAAVEAAVYAIRRL